MADVNRKNVENEKEWREVIGEQRSYVVDTSDEEDVLSKLAQKVQNTGGKTDKK